MDFEKLFERIGLCQPGRESFFRLRRQFSGEELAQARAAFLQSDEAFGKWLAENKGESSARELTMALYLLWSEEVYAEQRQKGMPQEVFFDSMVSMAEACRYCQEATGVYGIEQKLYRPWFRIFLLEKRLFRFGRLEFELTTSKHTLEIQGKTICRGQPCLYVHIPRYAPLEEEACNQAYQRAREFFREYFSMEEPVFFCRSWLLHPWLGEDLGARSRIVRFAKEFTLVEEKQDPWAAGFWIFDRRCQDPRDYPEDTLLRKKAKQRMVENLPIGVATGVRL